MPMNEDMLLRRLRELAPFADAGEARRAFDATLQALRRGLNEDEADWLAVALGPALSGPLLHEGHAGELTPDELYRWTKRYTKTRKGVAVEQAQVVCRTLAELLPHADIERLRRHLPELVALLSVPDPGAAPQAPRRPRSVVSDHTLAGGKPGASRPLSEAGGPRERDIAGARPDLSHAHSVARAREPHNDTMLSTSDGLTQEREGRSLATAGQRRR